MAGKPTNVCANFQLSSGITLDSLQRECARRHGHTPQVSPATEKALRDKADQVAQRCGLLGLKPVCEPWPNLLFQGHCLIRSKSGQTQADLTPFSDTQSTDVAIVYRAGASKSTDAQMSNPSESSFKTWIVESGGHSATHHASHHTSTQTTQNMLPKRLPETATSTPFRPSGKSHRVSGSGSSSEPST